MANSAPNTGGGFAMPGAEDFPKECFQKPSWAPEAKWDLLQNKVSFDPHKKLVVWKSHLRFEESYNQEREDLICFDISVVAWHWVKMSYA